jgi:hypothetical protein
VGLAEVAEQCPELLEEVPGSRFDPKDLRQRAIATVSPTPNRKPVTTGLETRSMTPPSRSRPAPTSTAAETIASPAESAAKRAVSPSASGATAAAESAEVAVVALTTSVRDVPSSA